MVPMVQLLMDITSLPYAGNGLVPTAWYCLYQCQKVRGVPTLNSEGMYQSQQMAGRVGSESGVIRPLLDGRHGRKVGVGLVNRIVSEFPSKGAQNQGFGLKLMAVCFAGNCFIVTRFAVHGAGRCCTACPTPKQGLTIDQLLPTVVKIYCHTESCMAIKKKEEYGCNLFQLQLDFYWKDTRTSYLEL